MPVRKVNAVLPESEKSRLQKLRENPDQRGLHERVVALRLAGWPLRAIGEPINVSRMSVHTWQAQVQDKPDALKRAKAISDVPPVPLEARGSKTSIKKMSWDVPEAERQELRRLADLAKTVRRWSSADSPEKQASDKLDELVVKYIRDRHVKPQTVAQHAGVTRRAIMARLERIDTRQDVSA